MKSGFRQWLKRLPATLTAPPSGMAERAQRIVALQRNIVLPARLVAIAVTFYMLYQSPWLSEVGQFGKDNKAAGTNTTSIVEQPDKRERQEIRATSYGVVFETIQNIVHGYTLLIVAATTIFFVVQKFPPGSVQWLVFIVGIGDGIFLAALTVLTGGYGSILYWVYPAVIVLNAISIPLATPQIVLNLLLTIFFGAAGLIEANAQLELMLESISLPASRKARETKFSAAEITNLTTVATALSQSPEPLNRVLWRELDEPTREKLSRPLPTGEPAEQLKTELVTAWNKVFFPPSRVVVVSESSQDHTETSADPYVLRLAVLLLLTFCCYGVQVLVAAQERAQEEQKEFYVRTGQLQMAGRLAAEFAHQIKNPLTIVNNVTFSLQKALQGGKPEVSQQVAIIQEEVAKADQIITQIMGYAQLSEGRVEKLDVVPEVNRAIQQVFPDGAMPQIKVHAEFAEEFPPLLMQRRHFSESVLNLLQNARDAVQSGGNIHVEVDCLSDYSVQIVVRDDGVGIPPDKRERIFEAYYTTKDRGTGLGLAIVKHNVDLYGGSVRVESELGKGAKFTLVFPAKSLIQFGK